MSAPTPPLTLIVAATVKNGIGKNGTLPWPMLKKEMAYFARVTKRVPSSLQRENANPTMSAPLPNSSANLATAQSASSSSASASASHDGPQNVVIMGRKTWESIPPKFRPLPARTNLVISRQDSTAIESIPTSLQSAGDVLVAHDIVSGLATLASRAAAGSAKPIARVFVIGGGAIYKAALELEAARHVLLTRVQGEWDCDTQFPVDLDTNEAWERRSKEHLEAFVEEELGGSAELEEEVKGEKVGYEFRLYEKK